MTSLKQQAGDAICIRLISALQDGDVHFLKNWVNGIGTGEIFG
jgi:hypothetical protein